MNGCLILCNFCYESIEMTIFFIFIVILYFTVFDFSNVDPVLDSSKKSIFNITLYLFTDNC